MLATLVIGLREGLEAALIVGIIAAFLRQNGRSDALRKMWIGVAVAVLMCLGVGLVLQQINSSLPQRQQEMLECVVAAIAVVMVSYMVLWMRKHSRSLKSDLHEAAGGALASGSATALVVMAFLAVFREGFETAVFLLAAFQSAVSPVAAATGAMLGIVIALGLGYLIYRGGVRLNLSKFFRITGVVLVLVAAGLVMSTLRAAYEAGWLVVGQQQAISLAVIARPGTVQESLLTGVLGIRSSIPVIEVVAYLLYLIPMLAVVLWPVRRAISGLRLGRVLLAAATGALVLAGALFALAPSAQSVSRASLAVGSSTSGIDPATAAAVARTEKVGVLSAQVDPTFATLTLTGQVSGVSTLRLSGHTTIAGVSAAQFSGTAVSAPATATAGLLTTLKLEQVAALGNGRLPIGLSTSGSSSQPVTASYVDSWTPTVAIDPVTGTILDLTVSSTRSVNLTNATGATFPGGTVQSTRLVATAQASAAQAKAAAGVTASRSSHQVVGQVIPALLITFALILLAFGLPHLLRRGDPWLSPTRTPVTFRAVDPPPDAPVADHERLTSAAASLRN